MILVTGGTGLVGSHLLFNLTKAGHKVRAIYRNKDRIELTKKVFTYYTDDSKAIFSLIDWVKCDLNDIPTLEIVFDKITHVYHCAALISFDPKNVKKLYKINVKGTANIVNLCVENEVTKLCHVSSIATIGPNLQGDIVDENIEFNETFANVYALSKQDAEMEVWRGSQEGLDVLIVNPGLIIGPGFWGNGSGTLFTKIFKGLSFYPPNGTGFIGVNDVANILVKLMNSTSSNERYILTSENLTYKKAFTKIAESLHKKAPKYQLKKWMLSVFWRLDWIKSNLTNSERILSKKMADSLHLPMVYNANKIQKHLNYNFEDSNDTIAFCASIFLQENLSR